MTEDFLISKEDTKKRIRGISTNPNDSACIIFGAGASFGYSNDHQYKAPIVKDLFNELNPVVGRIINLPKNKFIKNNKQDYVHELINHENDLEKYLSFLYSQNNEDNIFGNLLSYLEDIFFLASSEIATETNNYKALINLMWNLHGKKKWSCLSFNYDTLLEKSYQIAARDPIARNFDNLESYIKRDPVIVKVHGGINFRYILNKPLTDNDENEYTNHVLFKNMMSGNKKPEELIELISLNDKKPSSYRTLNKLNEANGKWQNISQFNFPLMLIPIHASMLPENQFFRDSLNIAKEQIKNANIIIAIGYNFGDEALIDNLKSVDFKNKDIILVGTKSSLTELNKNASLQKTRHSFPLANIKVFNGDGFDDFLAAIR